MHGQNAFFWSWTGYFPFVWTCDCVTGVSLARSTARGRPYFHREQNSENSQCVFVSLVAQPSTSFARSARDMWSEMSRKQDRYSSRPRSLTSHYGSSPSMLGSMLGQYNNPYSNSYSNYSSPSAYRNYNPYSAGFGRASSNLGIYGGTSSGYGGVYLSGATLGSLNLMTPVLKKLDKKLLASQKNFKPKPVPAAPVRVPEPVETPEVPPEAAPVPPVRPERKNRKHNLDKEKSRSLNSLETGPGLNSRSLSLNSLASDGYCVCWWHVCLFIALRTKATLWLCFFIIIRLSEPGHECVF